MRVEGEPRRAAVRTGQIAARDRNDVAPGFMLPPVSVVAYDVIVALVMPPSLATKIVPGGIVAQAEETSDVKATDRATDARKADVRKTELTG